MTNGLAQIIEALALRAERDGQPQPVPARLLRDVAQALAALDYIGPHGGAWEQRVAREGRAAIVVTVRERGTAAAVAPIPRRGPEEHQQGDTP